MELWVGIDVSMETLDFGWITATGKKHLKAANTPEGFREALSKTPQDAKFVMEATRMYYLNLAFFLHERGDFLSVVNPLCTKNHVRTELRRAKSDKTDALALSRFGQEKKPKRRAAMRPEVLHAAAAGRLRRSEGGHGSLRQQTIHAMRLIRR